MKEIPISFAWWRKHATVCKLTPKTRASSSSTDINENNIQRKYSIPDGILAVFHCLLARLAYTVCLTHTHTSTFSVCYSRLIVCLSVYLPVWYFILSVLLLVRFFCYISSVFIAVRIASEVWMCLCFSNGYDTCNFKKWIRIDGAIMREKKGEDNMEQAHKD